MPVSSNSLDSQASPNERSTGPNPLIVATTRGETVETRHALSYVVVDKDGVCDSAGNTDDPVFGRSSTKPLQALPLITTGAAEAFGLGDRHLALACASHNGEDDHVDLVGEWLERIDCNESDLECGVMRPFQAPRDRELVALGQEPDQRHHMCSGKHAGFLTLAKHLGAPTSGYIDPNHPVQQMVSKAIETLTGADLAQRPVGTDGCGVPAHATSLTEFAHGAWRFVPSGSPTSPADTLPSLTDADPTADACKHISAAMMKHPHLVAGTDRLCTQAMRAAPGQLSIKTGASGVFFAAARPSNGEPFALALKIHDGSTIAAEVAVLHLLAANGLDLREIDPAIEARHVIRNIAGDHVGKRFVLP